MNRLQVICWLNFIKEYRSKFRYDGLFVIESYEESLPESSVSGMKALYYNEYVDYYDALLFNNLVVSSKRHSLERMQYIATVATLLCKCDVELSVSLIEEDSFSTTSPIDTLENIAQDIYYENRFLAEHLDTSHPFYLIRNEKRDEMQKKVWQAQLQILFPLFESERIGFIEKHCHEIKDALAAEYVNYNKNSNGYITQYGERVIDPFDVELGTIHRMNHLKRTSDTSLYLLFLPNEKDRERIELLHDMRNSIAHVEPCKETQVTEFLSQYPYTW